MEDDNAIDVFRSLTSGELDAEEEGLVQFNGRSFKAKIRLRGNVLSAQAVAEAVEPLLFILVRHQVRKIDESEESEKERTTDEKEFPFGFIVVFKSEEIRIRVKITEARENLMVKVATAAHDMAQAELDELTYKLFTMNTEESSPSTSFPSPTGSSPCTLHDFFLTNPLRAHHKFSITQKAGVAARLIVYEEGVWESKLSISLPLELVKIYKAWTAETIQQLEAFESSTPRIDEPARQEMIRLQRENSETLEQTWEFLSTFSGPSFRRSTEKRRVAFAPVPTNLHLHEYGHQGGQLHHLLSAGVAAALPLRFQASLHSTTDKCPVPLQNGGLPRLRSLLSLHPAYGDVVFSAKRHELIEVKKLIGSLSHKLETEWTTQTASAAVDKVCVELQAGIKQAYARLRDVEGGLAGAERLVESLLDEGAAQDSLRQEATIGRRIIPFFYRNQVDNIDAVLVSLQTKIAVLHTLNDSPAERDGYSRNARESTAFALDSLLSLCECLLHAQQLGRLRSLSRASDAAIYTHIVIRADFVFSQAATIAATALMARLREGWPMNNDKPADLLLLVWSWLSCYGDERGMLEDATDAWRSVATRLLFRLVRAPSSVARNVTPLVSGHRHCLIVSLPIPQSHWDSLPSSLRDTQYLRVATSYWSLGVNHEATIGYQFGGVTQESTVNTAALGHLQEYSATRCPLAPAAAEALAELDVVVRSEPSRKNMLLYEWALAAATEMDGEIVVSCKSGKDRTAMGVTLEQGRLLRQASGLNATQAAEVVDALRKSGARREVCRKNIGKAAYSFSAFQMRFLPKSFRPPAGTFAHGLST